MVFPRFVRKWMVVWRRVVNAISVVPFNTNLEISKKWVKFTVESYMIEKECDYLFKYTSGTVSVHN